MARALRNYVIAFYEEKNLRRVERTQIRELVMRNSFPEAEFMENYKIGWEMVDYLCLELQEDLAPKTQSGYPVLLKVLTSLKILLSGHYQRGTGQESCHLIAQTTVSKYFQQFIAAVNRKLKPQWINFPSTEEARRAVAGRFQEKYVLPNILGAIDCTHVKLFPPPKPTQPQFMNRHGETTINVQLICDADCRILNVNANYPGRVHDQFIYNNSIIKTELKRLHDNRIGNYHLLGDSGYALEPWLMTPIRNAMDNSPEMRYTQWHCSARNVIERTNGYIKGTFRCLGIDRSLHYSAEKASQVTYACCTLYNIMKHFRLPMRYVEGPIEDIAADIRNPNARILDRALNKRNEIVLTYFN